MFFSRHKNNDEFSSILSKSLMQIELGNFDDALKSYALLKDLAAKTEKEEEKDFIIFSNLMRLYLKTIELKNYYINNSFSDIKYTLEYMRKLILDTQSLSGDYPASLDYFNKYYLEYSRLYMYHFYLNQMVTCIKHIYSLLEIGVGDNAQFKYDQLTRIYNKLVEYATQKQRDSIYSQLSKLKEEIQMVTLREQAYSKPSAFNVSEKQFKAPKIEVQKRDFIGTDTYNFDSRFSQMHKYLKRNNIDGAVRLYEHI